MKVFEDVRPLVRLISPISAVTKIFRLIIFNRPIYLIANSL